MMRVGLAVLGGEVAWTLPWFALGAALRAAMPGSFDADGATTSVGILLILVVGSGACSIAGGWVAAWIGRDRSALSVRIFAGVQLAVGVAVQASWWDRLPLWYHLAFLALLVPATLVGGWLREACMTPAPA